MSAENAESASECVLWRHRYGANGGRVGGDEVSKHLFPIFHCYLTQIARRMRFPLVLGSDSDRKYWREKAAAKWSIEEITKSLKTYVQLKMLAGAGFPFDKEDPGYRYCCSA